MRSRQTEACASHTHTHTSSVVFYSHNGATPGTTLHVHDGYDDDDDGAMVGYMLHTADGAMVGVADGTLLSSTIESSHGHDPLSFRNIQSTTGMATKIIVTPAIHQPIRTLHSRSCANIIVGKLALLMDSLLKTLLLSTTLWSLSFEKVQDCVVKRGSGGGESPLAARCR